MMAQHCCPRPGESGRVSGILAASGGHDSKRASAEAGETVALGKLDHVRTGDTISTGKTAPASVVSVIAASPRCWRWR